MKIIALKIIGCVLLLISLAGCTGTTTPLPRALTASMAQPNAELDQKQAIGLINQYRAGKGLNPLVLDPALGTLAHAAATRYARDGNPNGATALIAEKSQATALFSAGYSNFSNTFSGWRNSPRDAKTLTLAPAERAGLAVVYDPRSSFGTYWVFLID